jgi:protein SCO1/2
MQKEERQITIAHEEIPGFMAAMTMPFSVREDWVYRSAAPGSAIRATLVVQDERSWLEDIVIVAPAAPGVSAPSSAQPRPGSPVPNFVLVNQNGKQIRLNHYAGRALLITFIYTRCPLPDYCPLMMKNFAQIHAALRRDPHSYPRTQLVGVSLDPEYDTAEVLRKYGAAYTSDSGFESWEFASGAPERVQELAKFFGLNYWSEGGQIVHSLRTALVDPEGKLVEVYPGNDWRPADVLDELREMKNR